VLIPVRRSWKTPSTAMAVFAKFGWLDVRPVSHSSNTKTIGTLKMRHGQWMDEISMECAFASNYRMDDVAMATAVAAAEEAAVVVEEVVIDPDLVHRIAVVVVEVAGEADRAVVRRRLADRRNMTMARKVAVHLVRALAVRHVAAPAVRYPVEEDNWTTGI